MSAFLLVCGFALFAGLLAGLGMRHVNSEQPQIAALGTALLVSAVLIGVTGAALSILLLG